MNIYGDFRNYATQHMGISGMQFHYWEKMQETLYNNVTVSSSLTPYILEERELRATQMDIFSRLMMDRIVWLGGPVNDQMSTVVQAQLFFLENTDDSDIIFHIDSPGGSVKSGLSIVDMMEYVKNDIRTINTGMAASMGSVLLGAGTKGKRGILRHSRVMLHQVSGGTEGVVKDMRISLNEALKYNDELFRLLGEYCGKSTEEVMNDADRDFWMTGQEAVDYGIVDEVLTRKS
jgi:ATP-dependent Clp protease, protease subunit